MSPPDRQQRDRLLKLAARVGFVASAFAVFACGWFAMKGLEWKRTLLLTVLALGAGWLAATFNRMAR